ncbi:hypothetical protein ACJIZ3_005199 [Penstemon smallii]|uniref:Ribosomal protein S21 n=1 Tax=Penstemon smallii TaxID=265156 RepID=A0ABD3S466_9LAMI
MIHAVAKRAVTAVSTQLSSQLQQWRGIRVKVRNNNLDQALMIMQRKMQSSGIERMIKNEQIKHIKNSEKRVLAKKNLERRLRSQDLARKLKAILVQKGSLSLLGNGFSICDLLLPFCRELNCLWVIVKALRVSRHQIMVFIP